MEEKLKKRASSKTSGGETRGMKLEKLGEEGDSHNLRSPTARKNLESKERKMSGSHGIPSQGLKRQNGGPLNVKSPEWFPGLPSQGVRKREWSEWRGGMVPRMTASLKRGKTKEEVGGGEEEKKIESRSLQMEDAGPGSKAW